MKRPTIFVPCTDLIIVPCLVLVTIGGIANNSAMAGQPLPANAKFRGKTVAEWSFLQSEWAIATALGGQSLPDTVQNTQFLLGTFGPGTAEFDVTVRPGTALVSPPFITFGELYEDGTSDDPDALAPVIDQIFNETQLEVTLDGNLVLSGTPAENSEYTYGFTDPLFFDEPIFYAEPQDRGGIKAVAALWTLGIGAVYHPLSPGEHTLHVLQDSPVFGFFDTTWHISVVTLGAKNIPEPTSVVLLALSSALLIAQRRRAER